MTIILWKIQLKILITHFKIKLKEKFSKTSAQAQISRIFTNSVFPTAIGFTSSRVVATFLALQKQINDEEFLISSQSPTQTNRSKITKVGEERKILKSDKLFFSYLETIFCLLLHKSASKGISRHNKLKKNVDNGIKWAKMWKKWLEGFIRFPIFQGCCT